ncbi:MAG TPA: MBG domain-containing protein [Tepidisphaeraceae bacterium]|jgi:filamentous hemagglutinin family protein|nr:MBG domain-containing protein [Tepidisphaeraceae bacterium]
MGSTSARRRRILLKAIAPLLVTLPARFAWAAPHGGKVIAGSAAISGSGNALIVRQATNRAIINWTDFSISSSQTVQFVLPSVSSAVLNRVTSLTPSHLNGTMLSNGAVYLINPSGILVGPAGQIDVHGFVASSLDVNNAAFLAGGDLLFSGSSSAAVANQGVISAPGGDVVLIAQRVRNDGRITAPGGSVTLAAGTQVLLQQTTSPGLTVRVVGDGSATNSGVIQTTLAQLAANGGNAFALAINNTGIIRATGVQNANGHIYLTGGSTGAVANSGTLDASSATGLGGEIVVTGQTIAIDSQADLTAAGATGGGEILVGGGWEGADPAIAEALTTTVQSGAVLNASATGFGDGGTIVVRSDVDNPASLTRAYGSFLATGGPSGGRGGRIETSGYSLDVASATVSASASSGQAGQWLLDPYNVTISSSATSNMTETGTWSPTATANINVADINNALNGGSSVTIYTGGSNGGGDLGNIIVNAAIAKTSGASAVTLTLEADNNITVNQSITGSSGELNIVLDAHYGTSGVIILGSNLSTNGGNISFGTGRTSGGALVGGDVYLDGSGAQTLATGGGAVTFNGQVLIANPSGLIINSAGGAVDFESTVDSGDSYALGSDGSVTWDQAVVDAKGSTAGGAGVGDTYLATITSSLQNQVAANAAGYEPAWLGGKRLVPDPNSSTDPTSQVWYWVTGPLGLANGGTGTPFFTEYYTDLVTNAPDGTPINNAFANWNNGEPNNDGGANTTQNRESALEFEGTTSIWNDLPENSSTNPYLVETNLAPSPMTINAGAGQVTFRGLVGGNKVLASLTVTGPVAIKGGGVTTTGAQTYNNPVTLSTSAILSVTSADLNIDQNITYSGNSTAGLTLQASGNVTMGSNTAIAASGSGALNVTIDTHNSAGVDSGNSGAIVLNTGASISSNGGSITFGGGVSPASTPAYGNSTYINGIDLNSVTLNSSGGAITLNGTADGGAGVQSNNASISASGGAVSITSTGGVNFSTSTLTATDLLLSGSGTFTLTDASNAIGTLAANVTGGNILFTNSSSLTVGSISGTNGVTNTGGTVTLVANGTSSDVTLNNAVAGVGSGNTVVLAAGRNFINNDGSSAISPGSDRFLVYSTGLPADTFGGLSGGHLYDETYAGNPPGGVTASGDRFLFSAAPILTFTAIDQTKVYGQANPSLTYMVNGLIGGDTISQAISGTPTVSTTATAASGVNSYAIDAASGSLASLMGYDFNFVAGNLTVTRAALTITANDQTRPIGAPNPAFTASFDGLVGGDPPSAVAGLVFSTTANSYSQLGQYPIDISGGSSPNYTITLVDGTLQVTSISTQGLRTEAQSQQTLAPNFTPSSLISPVAAPTAETAAPPATGLAQLGAVQGYVFYRDTAPMRNDDMAVLSIQSGRVLLDAITHVSSFDLSGSKGLNSTVANDNP